MVEVPSCKALPAASGKPKQPARTSWLQAMLLVLSLSTVLGTATLLTVGHHFAGTAQGLAVMQSGRYGSAAASFARCVTHVRHQQLDQTGAALPTIISSNAAMLEIACMYIVAKREVDSCWAHLQPWLSQQLQSGMSATRHTLDLLAARLKPLIDQAAAGFDTFGGQVMNRLAEASPASAQAMQQAVRWASSPAHGSLHFWSTCASSNSGLMAPGMEHYHGWLQHGGSATAFFRGAVSKAGNALPAWLRDRMTGIVQSGVASARTLCQTVQSWLVQHARGLHTRLISLQNASAQLAVLLQECEQGSLTVEEQQSKKQLMQPPAGSAAEEGAGWPKQLSRAAESLGGWFSGVWRHDMSSSDRKEASESQGSRTHPVLAAEESGKAGANRYAEPERSAEKQSCAAEAPCKAQYQASLQDAEVSEGQAKTADGGVSLVEGTAGPDHRRAGEVSEGSIGLMEGDSSCTARDDASAEQQDSQPEEREEGHGATSSDDSAADTAEPDLHMEGPPDADKQHVEEAVSTSGQIAQPAAGSQPITERQPEAAQESAPAESHEPGGSMADVIVQSEESPPQPAAVSSAKDSTMKESLQVTLNFQHTEAWLCYFLPLIGLKCRSHNTKDKFTFY